MTSRWGLGWLCLTACFALGLPLASAQDYMNMVQAYGNAHVNMLQIQILTETYRVPGGSSTTPPTEPQVWPAHITQEAVATHQFTVDELYAMRHADLGRMRDWLHDRTITVQGLVQRSARADTSFRLQSFSGVGYSVWAYWPRGGVQLPDHGSTVAVRGVAEIERQNSLNMTDPEMLPAMAAPAPTVAAEAAASGTLSLPDHAALVFRRSSAVTEALAELLADTLAPALNSGHGRQDLVDLIIGGELQRAFAQALAPYGFSDQDLADVLASHLLMSWQVANDYPEDGPRSGVLAVREAVRDSLALAAWPGMLDDAQKQVFADTLVVGTMIIALRYLDGLQRQDRSAVELAMLDAQDLVRGYVDLDLTAFDLTEAGFVPR